MKYRIEFELPDNETVLKEIKTEPIKWSIWGYSGYAYASAIAQDARETLESLQGAIDQVRWERDVAIDQLKEIGKGLGEKMDDIVELLKEKEPVKPVVLIDTRVCGKCKAKLERQTLIGPNVLISENFNYCPVCGRKVKWDDI